MTYIFFAWGIFVVLCCFTCGIYRCYYVNERRNDAIDDGSAEDYNLIVAEFVDALPLLQEGMVPPDPTCIICLERLTSAEGEEQLGPVVQLPCTHSFHKACIVQWLATNLESTSNRNQQTGIPHSAAAADRRVVELSCPVCKEKYSCGKKSQTDLIFDMIPRSPLGSRLNSGSPRRPPPPPPGGPPVSAAFVPPEMSDGDSHSSCSVVPPLMAGRSAC